MRYMAKHPGGQDILLGVAGRDASVEFETMRHSAIALEQLERRLNLTRMQENEAFSWVLGDFFEIFSIIFMDSSMFSMFFH